MRSLASGYRDSRPVKRALRQLLGLLAICVLAAPSPAQDTLDVDALIHSLANGNEEGLLSLAGERVELALLGQRRRYTRAQAKYVIGDFFRRYPPTAFEVDHSLSQQDEWWLTGRYVVRYNGEHMRVYMRFRGRFPVYRLLVIQIIRS